MKTSFDNNQLLAQMQQLNKVAKSGASEAVNPTNSAGNEFGSLLTKAIDTVNQQQKESGQLARQIDMGDGGVSLVKAMIAAQKSSVAFQATVQVRNRVVSAYQDIMNMPI